MGGRADGALGCRRSQMGRWSASQIKWGAEMCPTSNEGSENLQPRLGGYQKSGEVAFFWFCLRTSSQSVFSPAIRLPYLLPSQYHPATEVELGDGYAQSGIRQVGHVTRGVSRWSLNAGAVLGRSQTTGRKGGLESESRRLPKWHVAHAASLPRSWPVSQRGHRPPKVARG